MKCQYKLDIAVFSFRQSRLNGFPGHVDVTFFKNEEKQSWSVWVYAVPKGRGARGNRRMLGSYTSGNPPDPNIAQTFILMAINSDEPPQL